MSEDDISARLLAFIRERFLGGDPQGELDEATPLLEWGVLDSLNTVILLNLIRDEFGVVVPPMRINARHFKTVKAITAMVVDLAGAGAADGDAAAKNAAAKNDLRQRSDAG